MFLVTKNKISEIGMFLGQIYGRKGSCIFKRIGKSIP